MLEDVKFWVLLLGIVFSAGGWAAHTRAGIKRIDDKVANLCRTMSSYIEKTDTRIRKVELTAANFRTRCDTIVELSGLKHPAPPDDVGG